MKGIVTCEDCEFDISIYRFTGRQGLFSVPKKWCEECDLLILMVKQTVEGLRIKSKTKITIKPWWLWWWQPLFLYFAWHAPILVINGKLISQGVVPNKENLIKTLQNVLQTTEVTRNKSILSLNVKERNLWKEKEF